MNNQRMIAGCVIAAICASCAVALMPRATVAPSSSVDLNRIQVTDQWAAQRKERPDVIVHPERVYSDDPAAIAYAAQLFAAQRKETPCVPPFCIELASGKRTERPNPPKLAAVDVKVLQMQRMGLNPRSE